MKRLALLVLLLAAASPARAQDRTVPDRVALAREAVALAASVPDPHRREVTERLVRERFDLSMDADIRALVPQRSPEQMRAAQALSREIRDGAGGMVAAQRRCDRLLEEGLTGEPLETETIRCFLEGEQHFRPRPDPALLLRYAEAMSIGVVRMQVLALAFGIAQERDPAQARTALERLRALRPRLSGTDTTILDDFLQQPDVLLFEGQAERAIENARTSRRMFALETLTAQLVGRGEIDMALRAAATWPVEDGCPFDGSDIFFQGAGEPRHLADFIDRLVATPDFRRACPDGIAIPTQAQLELTADRLDRARTATLRSGPGDIGLPWMSLAEQYIARGETDHARSLMLALLGRMPSQPTTGTSAPWINNLRLPLVTMLAMIGEHQAAERLARTFPGPGWRAVALAAAIVPDPRTRDGHRIDFGGPMFDQTH